MKVRVRKGDTLWYLSNLFLISVDLITASNPTIYSNGLKELDEIKVPGYQIVPYQIKRGDSFSRLASELGLSEDALLLLNQLVKPKDLTTGDTIFLPRRVTTLIVSGKKAYTFELLLHDMNELKKQYPFISIRTIGNSVLGKPLHEIKVGKGDKKVHINASFHANEWITSAILMKLLNAYLLSLTNGQSLRKTALMPIFSQIELSIVPMVNPDGVNLVLEGPPREIQDEVLKINNNELEFTGWKANIRGVDLNNQYPANWEIEKERKEPKCPAPRDFPGEAPLTEPEAIAMANLAKERQFDRVLAFHSQGKEFYWGYEGQEPADSEKVAQQFSKASGYKSIQYVDSHAGFKDWYIQEFHKEGYTIELGKGINPLPLSQFDKIYEDVLGIFLTALSL